MIRPSTSCFVSPAGAEYRRAEMTTGVVAAKGFRRGDARLQRATGARDSGTRSIGRHSRRAE